MESNGLNSPRYYFFRFNNLVSLYPTIWPAEHVITYRISYKKKKKNNNDNHLHTVSFPVKIQVAAVDPDEGDNGRVVYRISYSPNNDSEMFSIGAETGEVFANETPLYPGKHTIIVNGSDQPIDPKEMKYSLAVVTIAVVTEGTRSICSNRTIRVTN